MYSSPALVVIPASLRPTPAPAADLDTSGASLVSTAGGYYSSFPVDVVVYVNVQPSLIRFTCLPVSRVECLLRLPSLDVVLSSKKADIDDPGGFETVTPAAKGREMLMTPLISLG